MDGSKDGITQQPAANQDPFATQYTDPLAPRTNEQTQSDLPPPYPGPPGPAMSNYPPAVPSQPNAYSPAKTPYGAQTDVATGGPQPGPGPDDFHLDSGTTPYGQPGAVQYGQPPPGGIVVVARTGNCPRCGVGNIVETFTMAGICLAIWCFPCGLIGLFLIKERKCSHCGARVH